MSAASSWRAASPTTRQLLGLTDPYGANAPLAAAADGTDAV